MAEGKPGRPRVLVRRHKIELPEDLRELKEMLATHETAQIAKGFLSTNAGVIIATFGAISAMLAFPPTQRLITQFIAFWRVQITATAVDIFSSTVPSAEDIVDSLTEAAKKIPETAKEAWDRINRELDPRREDGETPPIPPFFPPVFPP